MKSLIVIGDISTIGGIRGFSNNIKIISHNYSNKFYFFNTNHHFKLFKKSNLVSGNFYNKFYYKILLYLDFVKILIFSKKSDVLILNELNAPIGLIYKSFYKKINYYLYIHGNYSTYLPREYKIYNKSFHNCKHIYSVSEYSKDIFLKRITNNIKIYVVPVGISTQQFYFEKKIKKENQVLFNGDITKKRKGFEFLLNYIKKYDFKFKLVVISNHEINDLRAKKYLSILEKKNIEYKVLSNISNDELRSIYNKSLFNFACANPENRTGEYEGLNITILEASACNTSSIGSKNTANECAFKYAKGHIIEYNNTKELNNIFNGNKTKYDFNNDVREWDDCFREILNYMK